MSHGVKSNNLFHTDGLCAVPIPRLNMDLVGLLVVALVAVVAV